MLALASSLEFLPGPMELELEGSWKAGLGAHELGLSSGTQMFIHPVCPLLWEIHVLLLLPLKNVICWLLSSGPHTAQEPAGLDWK